MGDGVMQGVGEPGDVAGGDVVADTGTNGCGDTTPGQIQRALIGDDLAHQNAAVRETAAQHGSGYPGVAE
ncbi:hypothetical protein, partial [Streptomyces sp. NPDC005301]|uniref:hypothetical protein n=1 Tax=Streptomyces sp. NPDC005301 TaxID=3156874 RepID=UPI0033AC4D74